jgi:hypothetical protein
VTQSKKIPKKKTKSPSDEASKRSSTNKSESIPPGEIWGNLLFGALDIHGERQVKLNDIIKVLERSGFSSRDARLAPLYEAIKQLKSEGVESVDSDRFDELVMHAGLLFSHALRGQLSIPDFDAFSRSIDEMYRIALDNQGGV